MTNNDDFDQSDFSPTEELAPPNKGAAGNIAEAWRTKPLFKLIVLMTAVAAVVATGVAFFGGNAGEKTASRLPTLPSIGGVPGGQTSPYMASQTEMANRNREQQAMENGGSAIATPIGNTVDGGVLNQVESKKDDPLNELKAEVERMKLEEKQVQQQQVQQQQVIQQQAQQQKPPEQFDDSLATAMQRQMSQLMDSWNPQGVKLVPVLTDDQKKADVAKASGGTTQDATAAKKLADGSTASSQQPKTLVPAGTVSYAQLLTEANSDVPGPIMAQIVSGPFNGARAIGQFQVANGYADYLVLQFTLVNYKGKDYPINAIALDPNTTLGGMATEVDQRYFTRVVLPAAAGFLQGFGQALGTGANGSTTTTNGTSTIISQSSQGYKQGMFQGLGQAAQTASEFFQNQANQTKPLVRVAAGTPMGMFFVSSVQDETVQQLQQQNALSAQNGGLSGLGGQGLMGQGLAGVLGNNPYATGGYPGTTVNGYGASQQSNVPYPNYATPTPAASPYSAFPSSMSGNSSTLYR